MAADCLPRLSPPAASPALSAAKQPVRKLSILRLAGLLKRRGHFLNDLFASQQVALHGIVIPLDVPEPAVALFAGKCGDVSLRIDDAELTCLAAAIRLGEKSHRFFRVLAFSE